MPIHNPGNSFTLSNSYGTRNSSRSGASSDHHDLDFAAPKGTKIPSDRSGNNVLIHSATINYSTHTTLIINLKN